MKLSCLFARDVHKFHSK